MIVLCVEWRRGRDSNPRLVAQRLISSQVQSTTLPPLRRGGILARVDCFMRLLSLILALFVTGCGESVLQAREKSKDFVILTRPGSPACLINEASGVSGFDCDLTRRLVQKLGLKSRVVVADSDADILQRLKRGRRAIGCGMANPYRRSGYSLQYPPIFKVTTF